MTAMTLGSKSPACRIALMAAAAAAAAALCATGAAAVSPQVRSACAGDYLSHCSAFQPESAQTRKCMRAVGYRLSKGCISALAAAGEVSRADIGRRSASKVAN
jgi:hypothetical protein